MIKMSFAKFCLERVFEIYCKIRCISIENFLMQKDIHILTFLMLLSCGMFMISKEIVVSEMTTADHSITIFVHGTFPARKTLQYSFGRFLIYCPQGLSLAKRLPTYYHFYKIAQGCVECNPEFYSLDQFYIFGWQSEHIYDKNRVQTAAILIEQLQKLVTDYYQRHGVIPKIRLLGFSHGGNVILHTANYLPLIVNSQHVEIEVWIFGTPIQHVNKNLVNSTNFTKVYSFYSKKDWIQRMDPQGFRNPGMSMKHFWSDRMFDIMDHCIQIEFTVNGKPISHTYYRSIFKYFPIIEQMVQEKSQGMNFGCIAIDLKK